VRFTERQFYLFGTIRACDKESEIAGALWKREELLSGLRGDHKFLHPRYRQRFDLSTNFLEHA
jgi:hypothetical protein